MRIGYFEHWHRPPYTFKEFMQAQGIEITKIDYTQKGYLEPFDVVVIEQNGFNDTTGRAMADKSCRKNTGVIQHQKIPGTEKIRKIVEM